MSVFLKFALNLWPFFAVDASPFGNVNAAHGQAHARVSEVSEPQDVFLEEDVASLLAMLKAPGSKRSDGVFEVVSRRHDDDDVTGISVAVSAMLLGTVTFMMLLFYTMNFPDEDIRYYACKTVGDAISIFVAVLLYEAVRTCMHGFLVSDPFSFQSIGIDGVQFLGWFAVLQVVGAVLARVGDHLDPARLPLRSAEGGPAFREDPEDSVPGHSGRLCTKQEREHWLRWRELQLRSASGILAHITGFAGISMCSGLLNYVIAEHGPLWLVLALLPMAGVIMWGIFATVAHVRRSIIDLDQIDDVSEMLWDSAVGDAADEAFGLVISFQFVNTIQYLLVGHVANRHGAIGDLLLTTEWHRVCFLMFIVAGVTGMSMPILAHSYAKMEGVSKGLRQVYSYVSNVVSMGFAWSVLYGARAGVHLLNADLAVDSVLGRILVALGVSVFAFFWVLLLDKCADSVVGLEDQADTHRALVKMIMSVGVLVGFAWELAFSMASDNLDKSIHGPANLLSVSLSLGLCVLVTPAYLAYITPIIEGSRRQVNPDIRRRAQPIIFASMFSWSPEEFISQEDSDEDDMRVVPTKSAPSIGSHSSGPFGPRSLARSARHFQVSGDG